MKYMYMYSDQDGETSGCSCSLTGDLTCRLSLGVARLSCLGDGGEA